VTQKPELLESVEAEYTDEALEADIEGEVRLKLTLDAEGNVTTVEIVEGLGYGLDERAREAAEQFEFRPARVNGEPAPIVLPFAIRFSLPEQPATLRGRIIEAETRDGLAGASVGLRYVGDDYETTPSAETTTNPEGRFAFREVPPGPYRLRVEVAGHRSFEQRLDLPSGDTVEVTYGVEKAPVRLSGRIREAGTRTPLAGVRIEVRSAGGESKRGESRRTVYTDETGRFRVRGLEAGRYRLTLEAQGYESQTVDAEIAEDERTETEYFLHSTDLTDYTVETRVEREQESVERRTVRLEEMRRIPGTGGDAVRAIQNMPGVARAPFSTGQVVVRGSTPQSTRTFIQGDEIPLIYHFFGGPSVINSEMLSSVDFYPGNFRARYGRALGGIVDLQTRDPKTDRLHGFTEIDVIDATAQVEGPIGEDVSFSLSARRSYVDAILPALLPDDSLQFTVAPRYYDYQGWLNWEISSEHELEFFGYGSDDRAEVLFEADSPRGNAQVQSSGVGLQNGFHRGQVRWEWRPDDLPIENDLMASFGFNRVEFEAARNLFFELDFVQGQIRDDFRYEFSETFEWVSGLDVQIGESRFSARLPRSTSDAPGDPGSSGGGAPGVSDRGVLAQGRETNVVRPAVYSELEIRPLEGLELVPGVRLDYYGTIEEWSPSPRFGTRWALSDLIALKGGVGLFTQPPNPGQVVPNFGNPNLTFQKAMHYSAGAEVTPLDYLEFDATLFYRDLFDLVRSTDDVRVDETSGRIEPEIYNNAGEGRSYGLELLVRHRPANRFFGWIAYTLSRAERRDPTTGEWNLFEFDQTHNLTLVAGYNLPWNVDVSARFRLVSGNPRTPVAGSVYDADVGEYQPVYGEPNSVRGPLFHQLDVRVDKTFVFDRWRLGLYLDVLNVYNATNREGTRYNYDYSESRPLRGLPILPTLGVNARF
jgi:TonB family protein